LPQTGNWISICMDTLSCESSMIFKTNDLLKWYAMYRFCFLCQ
jgi:hypothetical protein